MSRPVVILLAILLASALAGCAGGERHLFGSEPPPAGLSQDELLTLAAACHLLRVGQTNDVAVTDAAVIAAVDKYGLALSAIVARSNRLIRDYQSRGAALVAQATRACQRLAEATGVTSSLVRFESNGRPRATWLRVDGEEIADGFAERTIAELRRRKVIGLVINSPGGSVFEARKLGRFLRVNGLSTAVDQICTSACIDVLAGGVERYATRDARIGIHQSKVPSRYSSHEGGQLYVADSFRYLREMGIDAEVAIVAASVPHNQLLLISIPDALRTRLITGLVKGFQ